jgi:acyl-CoA thioester hydrolase
MTRPRTSRADYALFESYTTRWRDNDVYAHMNNAVYYEYVDSVVNGWLIRSGALEVPRRPGDRAGGRDRLRLPCEPRLSRPIEAGLRVDRIGTSSVTYGSASSPRTRTLAAAEAHFTHVCVDASTRRPAPLPQGCATRSKACASARSSSADNRRAAPRGPGPQLRIDFRRSGEGEQQRFVPEQEIQKEAKKLRVGEPGAQRSGPTAGRPRKRSRTSG